MDHGSAIVYSTAFFWRERVSRSRLDVVRPLSPFSARPLRILHRIAIRGATWCSCRVARWLSDLRMTACRAERIARYHVPLDLDLVAALAAGNPRRAWA